MSFWTQKVSSHFSHVRKCKVQLTKCTPNHNSNTTLPPCLFNAQCHSHVDDSHCHHHLRSRPSLFLKSHCFNFSSVYWHQISQCDWRTVYTGCPRRNVPDFRRVFLMLKYTDITQNTYVQSWTVMEIMAREKCSLLVGPCTVPVSWQHYPCPSLSVVSYYGSSAVKQVLYFSTVM